MDSPLVQEIASSGDAPAKEEPAQSSEETSKDLLELEERRYALTLVICSYQVVSQIWIRRAVPERVQKLRGLQRDHRESRSRRQFRGSYW